jgi:hypothetical protein
MVSIISVATQGETLFCQVHIGACLSAVIILFIFEKLGF